MKTPKHRFPNDIYIMGHNTTFDGLERDKSIPKDGCLDQEVDIFTGRKSAIGRRSGADVGNSREFHEEGLVAVYKLVGIIEVRQKVVVNDHAVRTRKNKT